MTRSVPRSPFLVSTKTTLTIERGRVQDHVASECEYTIVSCKYSNIGCTEKMKRKDMKDHEEDDKVLLHLSIEKINELSIGLEDVGLQDKPT